MMDGRCKGCGTPIPPSKRGRKRVWCTDKCRRDTLYGGTCERCGKRTNGSDGPGTAASICGACSRLKQREDAFWTRERILADAQRWHELFGRWPVSGDWNRFMCRGERRELLERLVALTGPWPHNYIVQSQFGSWRAFIEELGGEARPLHDGGRGISRTHYADELRRVIASLDRP